MHRLLNNRLKILYTKADTLKAMLLKHFHLCFIKKSWIDFKQFIKYSKPGPRYTSYPTAVEFSEDFAYDRYIEKLKTRDPKKPISIYIHLPFCRSACYFCGCNVIFTSKEEKKVRYIDYLRRELEILSQVMDTSSDVVQFHFGGGTPTFFSAEQLDEIMTHVKKHFPNFNRSTIF